MRWAVRRKECAECVSAEKSSDRLRVFVWYACGICEDVCVYSQFLTHYSRLLIHPSSSVLTKRKTHAEPFGRAERRSTLARADLAWQHFLACRVELFPRTRSTTWDVKCAKSRSIVYVYGKIGVTWVTVCEGAVMKVYAFCLFELNLEMRMLKMIYFHRSMLLVSGKSFRYQRAWKWFIWPWNSFPMQIHSNERESYVYEVAPYVILLWPRLLPWKRANQMGAMGDGRMSKPGQPLSARISRHSLSAHAHSFSLTAGALPLAPRFEEH